MHSARYAGPGADALHPVTFDPDRPTVGVVFYRLLAGRLLIWLINHLSLESGLYPLLAVTGGVATYGAVTVAGGSGFLAIYLAGVILGNSQLQASQNILRVNDGLAWLSQIMMFLLLGLLVTPSEFPPFALPGLLSTQRARPSPAYKADFRS